MSSAKPIFVATHPRACSTAFERVFMTRKDTLQCVHEPFGDAWYYGPERLAERYAADEETRVGSGFSGSTYKTILDRIERENTEGKRLFIKDMMQYFMPPDRKPASIAPSLRQFRRGPNPAAADLAAAAAHADGDDADEPGNPTVVPRALLARFHWTFLIRHPRSSVPSYYRCCVPPLVALTGFDDFMPAEAGYDELRRGFDYLRTTGLVGGESGVDVTVVDADDLLDNPVGVIREFCRRTGIPFEEDMLKWDSEDDHGRAKAAFEKWKGFHEDAIDSTELKPREKKKKRKSDEELYAEWTTKYGEKGAKVIKETVDANVPDYEYLKQFAIKV
ncbi:P-loop containing nucleoside triphosphate hydrolase protein [Lineolata rhizophorae]|uniref:P-loop containing nucleoside triphosphate hydrolase protein n=1 Tax=Lineolata rhizophorae TaxID=578093 RepID=A0A6A6NZ25_9PEZI|nr:P-loop containing nucleoside triphosphate hydrolase protein [Lineolata rhizophorae]